MPTERERKKERYTDVFVPWVPGGTCATDAAGRRAEVAYHQSDGGRRKVRAEIRGRRVGV